MGEVTAERRLSDEIGRLRQDIEQVRDELGHTLVALEDRASPKRIAERNKARARVHLDAAKRSASSVVESADKRLLVGGATLLAVLVVVRLLRH